jgi:hypothetical protein
MKTMVVVASKTVVALAAVVATLLMLTPGSAAPPAATTTATGLGSNCTRRCGNISIPYPFGIELGCYHGTGFNLTCKQHSHHQPPKLFLGDGTVEVLDISVEHSTVCIYSPVVPFVDYGNPAFNWTWGRGLPETGPYFLSESASMVSSCSASCPDILSRDGPIYSKR